MVTTPPSLARCRVMLRRMVDFPEPLGPIRQRIISQMTTGAPNTEVTVLMVSSVGANAVRAMRSQARQNTLPVRKVAGMSTMGRDVRKSMRVIWGTAMPTKEMGPAKAVTQADRMLDRRISATRNPLMLTPMLLA